MIRFTVIVCFVILSLSGLNSYGQTTDSTKTNSDLAIASSTTKESLDTEDSIEYLGGELLFQLRKRLHLTSEEEEKAKSKKKKKVVLNFGGIKIER